MNPFYYNLNTNYTWIFIFTLEGCLTSKTIRPTLRSRRYEALIRASPCSFFFPTHSPVKYKIIFFIWIPSKKVNNKSMSMNQRYFFFSIIFIIYIFFRWRCLHTCIYNLPSLIKCRWSIVFISILFLILCFRKGRTITWHQISISVITFMSNKQI